jgi:dTDP-4-dehydrorhamnose reductase
MPNWKFVEVPGRNDWGESTKTFTTAARADGTVKLVSIPNPQGWGIYEDARIGVTGAAGRLARALTRLDSNVISLVEDITNPGFDTHGCDIIINCAAKTDVCKAEHEEQLYFRSNVEGPYNLGRICAARGIRLVHISTDHVFSGRTAACRPPFNEQSLPDPQGVYAITKYLGEQAATTAVRFTEEIPHVRDDSLLKVGFKEKLLIIRTSFIDFFPGKKAFVDKYFSGDEIMTIGIEILKAAQMDIGGILHIGTGKKSIYDVARKIAPGVQPQLLAENPINSVGLPYLKDTSLDTSRWEEIKRQNKWV